MELKHSDCKLLRKIQYLHWVFFFNMFIFYTLLNGGSKSIDRNKGGTMVELSDQVVNKIADWFLSEAIEQQRMAMNYLRDDSIDLEEQTFKAAPYKKKAKEAFEFANTLATTELDWHKDVVCQVDCWC